MEEQKETKETKGEKTASKPEQFREEQEITEETETGQFFSKIGKTPSLTLK